MPRPRKFAEAARSDSFAEQKQRADQSGGREVPAFPETEAHLDVAYRARDKARELLKKERERAEALARKAITPRFLAPDDIELLLDDEKRTAVVEVLEEMSQKAHASGKPREEVDDALVNIRTPERLFKTAMRANEDILARTDGTGAAGRAAKEKLAQIKGLQTRYNEEQLAKTYEQTLQVVEGHRRADEAKKQEKLDVLKGRMREGAARAAEAAEASYAKYDKGRRASPLGMAASFAEKYVKDGRFDEKGYREGVQAEMDRLREKYKNQNVFRDYVIVEMEDVKNLVEQRMAAVRSILDAGQVPNPETVSNMQAELNKLQEVHDAIILTREEANEGPELEFIPDTEEETELSAEDILDVEEASAPKRPAKKSTRRTAPPPSDRVEYGITKPIVVDGGETRTKPEPSMIIDMDTRAEERRKASAKIMKEHPMATAEEIDTSLSSRKRNRIPQPIAPTKEKALAAARFEQAFEAAVARAMQEGFDIDEDYVTTGSEEEEAYFAKINPKHRRRIRSLTQKDGTPPAGLFPRPKDGVDLFGATTSAEEWDERKQEEIRIDAYKKAAWLLDTSRKNPEQWRLLTAVLEHTFPEIDPRDFANMTEQTRKELILLMSDKMEGDRFMPHAEAWAPQRTRYQEIREIQEGDLAGEAADARKRRPGKRAAIAPSAPTSTQNRPTLPESTPPKTIGQRISRFFKSFFGGSQ